MPWNSQPTHRHSSNHRRGADVSQPVWFITKTAEGFAPKEHPLRVLRKLADQALVKLDRQFERLEADEGRISITPERLIRASLLQVLHTIRSERSKDADIWLSAH